MTPVRIEDASDPRIQDFTAVADPALARSQGLFVAEGRLVVRRVIEHGGYRVRSVLVNDAALQGLSPVLERLPADAPVYVCEPRHFLELTGFNIHRGCLALVERPAPLAIDDVIADARTVIVLDGITDADNVGGAFRNAAALGGDAVILSPACCDPLYRKAIRTSMATVLGVPFARAEEWPGALERIRASGFVIAALTPREPSESIAEFARRRRHTRIALVFGTEGDGLTPDVEALAEVRLRIPMAPGVDSLNVAVAIGIALYAIRQH